MGSNIILINNVIGGIIVVMWIFCFLNVISYDLNNGVFMLCFIFDVDCFMSSYFSCFIYCWVLGWVVFIVIFLICFYVLVFIGEDWKIVE